MNANKCKDVTSFKFCIFNAYNTIAGHFLKLQTNDFYYIRTKRLGDRQCVELARIRTLNPPLQWFVVCIPSRFWVNNWNPVIVNKWFTAQQSATATNETPFSCKQQRKREKRSSLSAAYSFARYLLRTKRLLYAYVYVSSFSAIDAVCLSLLLLPPMLLLLLLQS